METVELKKEVRDGKEYEYFAHGGHEVEGEFIKLTKREVFVSKYDMVLLNSIRKLPVIDILKMTGVSFQAVNAEIEEYRKQLNSKFHTFLCTNFISKETGDAVRKNMLFDILEFKYSYETYIRKARKREMEIEEVESVLKVLCSESENLMVAMRGDTFSSSDYWESLLN